MRLYDFKKETSERSDDVNWVKQLLELHSEFRFGSIEGCNQNAKNQTTHLFERAHVSIDLNGQKSKDNVLQCIVNLEGEVQLQQKIYFAQSLGLPLSYVLYNDDHQLVFLLEMTNIADIDIIESFNSYASFGVFLSEIKGWKSKKSFREQADLPFFDKTLRANGTPWPTNIDCFCSDISGRPVAIIEYQNAKSTGVLNHSNNSHFHCKLKHVVNGPNGNKIVFHDDIRRWNSLEILRVQSELPLILITWSQSENHYQCKEVEKVVFPDFEKDGSIDWELMGAYKEDLHRYTNDPKSNDLIQNILARKTISLAKSGRAISLVRHDSPLDIGKKTFPKIYWKRKAIVENDRKSVVDLLERWLIG